MTFALVSESQPRRSARFSPCGLYRYDLWRIWDYNKAVCMFIGLNPSTADATQDDPTIRRCVSFAKAWGYGALCMGNLFAFRATLPSRMMAAADPIGPDNDKILAGLASGSGIVIAAWGNLGWFLGRENQVKALIPRLHCLKLNREGSPAHPLYLPANLKPVPFV